MSTVDDMPVKAGRRALLNARKDSWRVVCPKRKHTTISRKQGGHFYCETCNERYEYALDNREKVLLKG